MAEVMIDFIDPSNGLLPVRHKLVPAVDASVGRIQAVLGY
jgi:hypothetical protein